MANYKQKIDFLTQSIVKYIKENEINIDDDDHLDIVRDYIYNRFKITLDRKPIKDRIKKISNES